MLSLSILGLGTLVKGGLLANFKSTSCSPARINRWDTAPTPTTFAKLVSDAFRVFHARDFLFFLLHTAMTKQSTTQSFQLFTSCCLLQKDRLDPWVLQKHLAISLIPLPFVAAP
jgi:hypothetical protein